MSIILCAYPIRGELHIQRNANGEVATVLYVEDYQSNLYVATINRYVYKKNKYHCSGRDYMLNMFSMLLCSHHLSWHQTHALSMRNFQLTTHTEVQINWLTRICEHFLYFVQLSIVDAT